MTETLSDLNDVIDEHLSAFDKRGVLSIRPGFKEGGAPARERAAADSGGRQRSAGRQPRTDRRRDDAGVISYNETAAQYFQQIFLHDWDNLAVQKAQSD